MNSYDFFLFKESIDQYIAFLKEEVVMKNDVLNFLNINTTKNIIEIHREEKLLHQLQKKISRYNSLLSSISIVERNYYEVMYNDLIQPDNVDKLSLKEFMFLSWFADNYDILDER